MIYILTVRNKSGLHLAYKKAPASKLVFEFAAPDSDVAMDAIRDVLREFSSNDAYVNRAIEEAMDDTRDSGYANFYNACESGLQIDWKVIE